MPNDNILIIGLPGAGKTTTSKILAEQSGKKVVSTDPLFRIYRANPEHPVTKEFVEYYREEKKVEIDTSKLADGKIFRETYGEDIFRAYEHIMIRHVLTGDAIGEDEQKIDPEKSMLDLSASAFLREDNRNLLAARGLTVVYLNVEHDVLMSRLAADYEKYKETKKVIRGAYEMAAIKAEKEGRTAEEGLREQTSKDRTVRHEEYLKADIVIDINEVMEPEIVANRVMEAVAAKKRLVKKRYLLISNSKVKDLYFFRHGRTDWNVEKRIQGQTDRALGYDIPLNKEGILQAKALIPFIKEKSVEVIFSSPLIRALQTASIAATVLKLPIFTHDGLREMFFGDYEGYLVEEFKKLVPNGIEIREQHKDTNPIYDDLRHPGGESKKEVRERAFAAIEEFCKNNDYQKIGIPTHNAVLRFILSTIDIEQAKITVDHAEIIHIKYDPEKNVYFFVNRFKI